MPEPTKPSAADMAVNLVVPGDIDGSSFDDLESIMVRLRYAETFVERCRVLEERLAEIVEVIKDDLGQPGEDPLDWNSRLGNESRLKVYRIATPPAAPPEEQDS